MYTQQTALKNFFGRCKGFTFMELSIAIMLLSILVVSATLFYTSLYEATGKSLTQKRLNTVEQAINIYVIENGHLPCPADPTVDVRDSSFGEEDLLTPGDSDTACDGLSSSNIFFGAVPTKALNLSGRHALDGWKNKISYFVRVDFATDEPTFKATAYNSTTNPNLVIKTDGTAGTTTEENAIYVLVSHGYNGRGAYASGGGQIEFTTKPNEDISDESYLSEDTNRYTVSFDETFVQDWYDKNFDDTLVFKAKMNLIYDAGWEGIGCLSTEIDDSTTDSRSDEYVVDGTTMTWDDGTFVNEGESLTSAVDCSVPSPGNWVSLNPDTANTPARICGPYGQWSNVVYECVTGCAVSISNPSPTTYYIPEENTLYEECPTGEVGQIVHTCPTGGGTATEADGCH